MDRKYMTYILSNMFPKTQYRQAKSSLGSYRWVDDALIFEAVFAIRQSYHMNYKFGRE